jgi:putative restriction endonuclease
VTGCDISQIIEAAHILPYRGEEYNHPSNGLLLRADIHTLFDLNMLWIEPSKFKVVLHPEALKGEYAALNGKRLAFAKGKPSIDSLEWRWNLRNRQLSAG